jgi:DNA polymerase-1
MAPSLYLFDAHAHLYAAYFAISSRLTSPSGEPTNAVLGVVKVLLKVLRERKPDAWAVVFDPPGPVFRNELFAEYKAHRKPMPDDMRGQPTRLRQVLAAMDVPVFEAAGFEADDVLGTLVKLGRAKGMDVYVCSKDKDFGQLLEPGVFLYDTRTDAVIDEAKWVAEWGVKPSQVIDLLALMGDTSDNIPGAKGVGEKTAAKLIGQFGSLDALLARTGELKGKQKENIEAFAAQAPLSKRLVTINTAVPLTVDFSALHPRPANPLKVVPLFRELGFRTLLEELVPDADSLDLSDAPPPPPPPPRKPRDGQPSDNGSAATATATGTAAPTGEPEKPTPYQELVTRLGLDKTMRDPAADDGLDFDPAKLSATAAATDEAPPDYRIVDTPELLAALATELSAQRLIAFDTETDGLNPHADRLVGLSFSWKAGQGWYVPVIAPLPGKALPVDEVLAALKPVLENPAVAKTGQNAKFDILVLRAHGVELRGLAFDSMVAAACVDPARREVNIDALAADYLGLEKIATEELIGKGKKQITMADVPVHGVAEYAGQDADYAYRLKTVLEPELDRVGVRRLFEDVELPLVAVLADMEAAGIRIDPVPLERMSVELDKQISQLRHKIIQSAGVEFNPDSPKQLADVLFKMLKLKGRKRTSTGVKSTDVDVLNDLADQHPVPAMMLEYRQLSKLKGTYVDALPQLISPADGRVHAIFRQTGAETGRISSSDPNLQNIPTRTAVGRQIREAFVAGRPGDVLLTADYSQIELRLLAHFSGDETLIEAFRADRDIHRFVAAQVFGVPEDKVTSDQRYKAKTVNFGIIYGQSAFGLSRTTGMRVGEAREFINEYFARYPRVQRFINDCIRTTERSGIAPTVLGRKRKVEAIGSTNRSMRGFGERLAVNTVLQGSAADLIKTAMVNIHRKLNAAKLPARLLLQIHDELVFELPESRAEEVGRLVTAEMTAALPLTVPLKVDVAWGRNWREVG